MKKTVLDHLKDNFGNNHTFEYPENQYFIPSTFHEILI